MLTCFASRSPHRWSSWLPVGAAYRRRQRRCGRRGSHSGRVALRTRRSLLTQIIDRAKREHPYEVPSVVAVPIIDGSPDYLGWIMEQTEQPA